MSMTIVLRSGKRWYRLYLCSVITVGHLGKAPVAFAEEKWSPGWFAGGVLAEQACLTGLFLVISPALGQNPTSNAACYG